MRMHMQINRIILIFILFVSAGISFAFDGGKPSWISNDTNIGRIQLVSQQLNLLKTRLDQSQLDLERLAENRGQYLLSSKIQKANKRVLDKAELDLTVSKSNLDSIDIELSDSRQTIDWLEKGVQETENQLHVLNVFGKKIARSEVNNTEKLATSLKYQKQLLDLEKKRIKYLHRLQTVASNALHIKEENSSRLNNLVKSKNMIHLKQKQMKDELIYQQQQNHWLKTLNNLTLQLAGIDAAKNNTAYTRLEHQIFYANENANYAYIQSLIARYADQIDQMRLAMSRAISITLLNEIGDQGQILVKQTERLKDSVKSRQETIASHIDYLKSKMSADAPVQDYINKLVLLKNKYAASGKTLVKFEQRLDTFRRDLDNELQKELSSRQGFPSFSAQMLFDLGKELLLVPALTFQEFKSLSLSLVRGVRATSGWGWAAFFMFQLGLIALYIGLRKFLQKVQDQKTAWREKMNSKWICLQWLTRNSFDVLVIVSIVATFSFFSVPVQYYGFVLNLAMVWLVVKSIITVSRLCLVETTHDAAGHDVRLFYRLKWLVLFGAVITAVTVFVHQLPLIYELKALCDWIFLLLLMVVSVLLLKSWRVVPNMIISHMDRRHPYFEKSIYLFSFLIPALMFANSLIGLMGYVNLIMTISRYEGIFLVVLIGYLVFRGLLSDGMEQLSRVMIRYVSNGWLLTEAFLKPLDTILRICLMLSAGAVLFLLYGWDAKSPIVERLMGLLHYQLTNLLNTTITPLSIIQLGIVISVFYWTAKWIREFVYRFLENQTKDMGIRNSLAILSQYMVVVIGIFMALRVLGVDLTALAAVAAALAFGIGFGLRDLASNFVCGFLILLERPLRVGDRVSINDIEGEVINIGSRAVSIRTYDHIEYLVPNSEIFNKSFINLTAKDNIVRTKVSVQIQRHDNPHHVKAIIQNVIANNTDILKDPMPNVFLREMEGNRMAFEMRYFVDIRQVDSRSKVVSDLLMTVWDEFNKYGIKAPFPQHEIYLHGGNNKALFGIQGGSDVI